MSCPTCDSSRDQAPKRRLWRSEAAVLDALVEQKAIPPSTVAEATDRLLQPNRLEAVSLHVEHVVSQASVRVTGSPRSPCAAPAS